METKGEKNIFLVLYGLCKQEQHLRSGTSNTYSPLASRNRSNNSCQEIERANERGGRGQAPAAFGLWAWKLAENCRNGLSSGGEAIL